MGICMKALYLSAAIFAWSVVASWADEPYPVAGIISAGDVSSVQTELTTENHELSQINENLKQKSLPLILPEIADKCFTDFSVTTDAGKLLRYQLSRQDLQEFNIVYRQASSGECTFDRSSRVEICKTSEGEFNGYYPDPADLHKYLIIENLSDMDAIKLNPKLMDGKVLELIGCDQFKDQLVSHIATGTQPVDDSAPVGIGAVVRRALGDEQFLKALKGGELIH